MWKRGRSRSRQRRVGVADRVAVAPFRQPTSQARPGWLVARRCVLTVCLKRTGPPARSSRIGIVKRQHAGEPDPFR